MINSHRLIFIFCVILFLVINIYTIKDGHNWGGDFCQYVRHAKNILEHKDYSASPSPWQKLVYPPGFPILIAPVIKYFGINFKVLKSLNIIFWLLFVFITYLIMYEQKGKNIALLCAILLLSSPWFFMSKQQIMSDIPFVFFVTASIYSFSKYYAYRKSRNAKLRLFSFAVFIILSCFAFLIRVAGVALFIASIYYLYFVEKNKKLSLLVILALIITIGLQKICGASSNYSNTMPYFSYLFRNIRSGIYYALQRLTVLFFPLPYYRSRLLNFLLLSLPFVLFILTFNIYKRQKKSISFVDCFVLIYLIGTILWPRHSARFMLPIIGPVLIYSIEAATYVHKRFIYDKFKNLNFSSNKLVKFLLILVIFYNIAGIAYTFDFNDDSISKKETQEMINWVESNTSNKENIAFRKDRMLTLFTDRAVMSYPVKASLSQQKEIIHDNKITWVILRSYEEGRIIKQIELEKDFVHMVWENKDFKIFVVQKE